MEFTLVVPTLGRTKELGRLLDSVANQRFQKLQSDQIEIFVVDQNLDDRLVQVLAPFQSRLTIHHLRSQVRNSSHAKNLGIARAKGRFIAFPDDDCWFPQETLETAWRELLERKDQMGVFGRVSDPAIAADLIAYPKARVKIGIGRRSQVFLGLQVAQFYPTQVVKKMGGFDEKIGPGNHFGSGEESDFALRVLECGHEIEFLPHLEVYHPMVDASSMTPEKAFRYGLGFGAVCRKHDLWGLLLWKVFKQLAGVILFSARAAFQKARFSWATARGRMTGFLTYQKSVGGSS